MTWRELFLCFRKNSPMDGIRYEQLGFLQINLDGKELVKDNSVAFHNKITKKCESSSIAQKSEVVGIQKRRVLV